MTSGIYKITNVVNGKFYIGSAINILRRWGYHEWTLNDGSHPNKYLQSAWVKYGGDNFEFSAIEAVTKNDLSSREQFWIDTTNCCNREIGYNLRPNADSNRGIKHSKEAVEKRAAKLRGIPRSEEVKKKISAKNKGRKLTEERKKQISEFFKGRPSTWIGRKHTEETKKKISVAQKGKPGKRRDKQKWPHEKGKACECIECKLKRNEQSRLWAAKRRKQIEVALCQNLVPL